MSHLGSVVVFFLSFISIQLLAKFMLNWGNLLASNLEQKLDASGCHVIVLRSESATFALANQVTATQPLKGQVVQPQNLSGPMPHSEGTDMRAKRRPGRRKTGGEWRLRSSAILCNKDSVAIRVLSVDTTYAESPAAVPQVICTCTEYHLFSLITPDNQTNYLNLLQQPLAPSIWKEPRQLSLWLASCSASGVQYSVVQPGSGVPTLGHGSLPAFSPI